MHPNSIIVEYDTQKFPFAKVLAALVFRTPDLENLHRYYQHKKQALLEYEDNLHLRNLMQKLQDDTAFYKIYHSWVMSVIAPHFANKISYSAHPKMRVHLSGTGSVSNFHRDADVTKREQQINCYLPFTDVFDSNTLWAEDQYDSSDYHPINLRYGQAILWDGGFLRHGTIANETGITRVSCDFRFQPKFPEQVLSPWSDILAARPAGLVITDTGETQKY